MESLTRCDVSLIVNPVGCFPQLSLYLLLSRNLLSVIFLMFALASSTYLFHLKAAQVVRKGDQVTGRTYAWWPSVGMVKPVTEPKGKTTN